MSSKVVLPILMGFAMCVAPARDDVPSVTESTRSIKNDLSGAEMYRTYCASCHGGDGRGAGPAAAALKRIPPDLTQISLRNKGRFPSFRVTQIIDGYEVIVSHGSREMPLWGNYFRDNKGRDEAILKLREHNLTEYLRSIQQKQD